jgi:hypothetical protein
MDFTELEGETELSLSQQIEFKKLQELLESDEEMLFKKKLKA